MALARRARERRRAAEANDAIDEVSAALFDRSGHPVIELASGSAVDFSGLTLKPDHERRPFWVTPIGSIFLEATNALYEQARDFLVAIAEPVSRPEFIHEYRLDKNALFAAASMGMTPELIIGALSKLSKVPVHGTVEEYVRACTSGYGKCKLVLKRGKYYVESGYPSLLRLLSRHPVVRAARVHYAPNGKRYTGSSVPASSEYRPTAAVAAAAAGGAGESAVIELDEEGFEVSTALTETEGSLGLQGILVQGEQRGAAGAGAQGKPGDPAASSSAAGTGTGAAAGNTSTGGGGDTGGGTLSSRFAGEIGSDEEDEAAIGSLLLGGGGSRSSRTASQTAGASTSSTAVLDRGSLSRVILSQGPPSSAGEATGSSIVAELGDDFGQLSAADIDAMMAAVEEVEAMLSTTTTKQKGAPAPAANATTSPSATPAGLSSTVSTRRPTSFHSDLQRMGLTGSGAAVAAASSLSPVPVPAPLPKGDGSAKRGGGGGGASASPSESQTFPEAPSVKSKDAAFGDLASITPAQHGSDVGDQPTHAAKAQPRLKLKLVSSSAAAASSTAPTPASVASAVNQATPVNVHDDEVTIVDEVAVAAAASDAAPMKRAPRPPPTDRTKNAVHWADGTAPPNDDGDGDGDVSGSSDTDAEGGLLELDSEEEADLRDMGILMEQGLLPESTDDADGAGGRQRGAPPAKKVKKGGGSAGTAARRRRTAGDDDDDDAGDADFDADGGGGSNGEDDDDDSDDGFRRRKKRRKKATAGAMTGEPAGAAAAAAAPRGKGRRSRKGAGAAAAAAAGLDGGATRDSGGSKSAGPVALALRLQADLHSMHTPGRVESFEIDAPAVDAVRRVCRDEFFLPLIQEYDFRLDTVLPSLRIALRDASALRPYQERSLSKMFGNGRARSGIIVLPCGAGKTLVGISAAATLGKSCIVLCPNQTSVYQWVEQFSRFTDVRVSSLVTLTAKKKEPLPPLHEAVVLLTTYSMIGRIREETAYYGADVPGGRGRGGGSAGGGRGLGIGAGSRRGAISAESESILRDIAAREWGLMLLDEVHQAVANTFRKALRLRAHCRLGLTATLVREDGRDRDLAYLIGPKLYEANWRDLTRAGYLANVQVTEVWCPMTSAFYREYLRAGSMNAKKALAVMNPVKCWAMDRLLAIHEARGDKIIVFSESVFALQMYAERYASIAICGDTPMLDRETFIRSFKTPNSGVNKLFLSRVGDVALDVPDANVIIQISSHFGSRLQEAQRMGRILRRGSAASAASGFNSFFYTLISMDTLETYFSNKRRRYLVDQGYAYVVRPADGLVSREETAAAAAALGIVGDDDSVGGSTGGSSFLADLVSPGDASKSTAAAGAAAAAGGAADGATGASLSNAAGANPAPKAGSFFSTAGMEALRKSSRFMRELGEQLRVLEVVLRENLDEVEGREDKLFAEYASEFELAKAARDAAAATRPRSDAAGGADAAVAGAPPRPGSSAVRTLEGRHSVDDSVLLAAGATSAAAVMGLSSSARAGGKAASSGAPTVQRRDLSSMASLSGGLGLSYLEYTSERSGLEQLRAAEEGEAVERGRRGAAAASAEAAVRVGAPKPQPPRSRIDDL